MTTTLKPLQIEALIANMIDCSMKAMQGRAIIDLRKAYPNAPEMRQLNKKLIEIELSARKSMRSEIEAFINNCPVS